MRGQRALARALRTGWREFQERGLQTSAAAAQQAAPQPDTIEVRQETTFEDAPAPEGLVQAL
jgi:hypothetical protein